MVMEIAYESWREKTTGKSVPKNKEHNETDGNRYATFFSF